MMSFDGVHIYVVLASKQVRCMTYRCGEGAGCRGMTQGSKRFEVKLEPCSHVTQAKL